MGNPIADFPWKYAHVAATALVSSGRCVLHTIVVNGLTTQGDITVRDGTDGTGTVVAILHLDLTTSVSVQPITLTYDCLCPGGLYIEYDQAVAADLTVNHM
ncbi:hypothetical protein KKE60_04935 [Patescibacteria group bacterium]|nr:hypothetical protein [Patescibacteria group bacterium]